ncbi:MAG TPA: hypothetical protein VKA70_02785 [Blastocatellia bacterium]|nr:hypothetical protein [Blastocatellia bacterium]
MKSERVMLTIAFLICALAATASAGRQDQTRGLRLKKVEQSRPASATDDTAGQPRTYRSTTSTVSSSEMRKAGSESEAILGVTLWRLRAAESADGKGARLLEQRPGKSVEWTAERIEAGTPLNEGDRVRISIESPTTGYLYVIDRERYSDGTTGDAYAIFPTTRTRGGDNAMTPGRVIEFPAQEDNPPYFTLSRSRKEHQGEELILIVSPRPLAEIPASATPVKLPAELLAEWEKQWGGRAEQFELEGGAGRQYTAQEKAAGTDGARMLTQTDPLPQTVLRVNAKPGNALLVKVVIGMGK